MKFSPTLMILPGLIHGPIPLTIHAQMSDVWQIFDMSLGFPSRPIRANTFKGQIQYLFPKPARLYVKWFSCTIREIQNCGLEIKRTTKLLEHLDLKGDTLKIYVPGHTDIEHLHALEYNVVAQ